MNKQLTGRVLITGGTGSLGTAIVDRAAQEEWDVEFTVLARSETRMAEFLRTHPYVRGEIGDVRDLAWLNTIVPGHDICIHAAAIKQVPTAEANVREAMLTNVVGSQNVAMACVESGVKRVIGISTDKACAPCTTYGATKYLMEGLFREADGWSSDTDFVLVRYGNVLRSNASVVPLFEKQIANNDPFTVTDRNMTRFWLTMGQAIDLILAASDWYDTGVVIVPRPPALSMKRLAEFLDPDRRIFEIGARPGEKKHELLINESEARHTEQVGPYFVIYPPKLPPKSPLPEGFTYSSQQPDHWIDRSELFMMLNSYNPYGGKEWKLE